uniref:Flavin-containing monooxygenase n=1 Tax=Parastrongyloides trichosuri TaxID=131310 RepID=A0A0N5A1B5_PARTI
MLQEENEKNGNEIEEPLKRICIIGGGARGICCLKRYTKLKCHVDLYEAEDELFNSRRVGTSKSNVFDGELASMPTIVLQYYNVSFKKNDSFPTQQEVLEYLENYCKTVKGFIKFNHRVIKTEYIKEDNNWNVTIERGNDKEKITLKYDIILVCSGRKDKPFIPNILKQYKGNLLHSKDYKNPLLYKNKRVGIIGNDIKKVISIAESLIGVAEKVYFLDVTFLHKNFKKNTFPESFVNVCALQYKIEFKGDVFYFKGEENNGIQLDTLISATGYQLNYPFLEHEEFFDYDNKRTEVKDLILDLVHYSFCNSLFFIGQYDHEELFKFHQLEVETSINIIEGRCNFRKLGTLRMALESFRNQTEDNNESSFPEELNDLPYNAFYYNNKLTQLTTNKEIKELGNVSWKITKTYLNFFTYVKKQYNSFEIRIRRQAFPPNPAPFQKREEDYNLPPFYNPYPGRDASSLSPIFPFTSTFNNGLDVNPGTRITVDGNLNVPILGWGMWDYRGGVRTGRPNTRVGFGALGRPTNIFKLSPETIETLAKDVNFNKAREEIPSIPVAVLPGNFVPLRCKPPLCNPFVHNAAFGVDVEPGDDYMFDAGIDFPLPLAPGGVGVRFPLSGGVNVGSDPLVISYGHGMGPVVPPNFERKSVRDMKRKSLLGHVQNN